MRSGVDFDAAPAGIFNPNPVDLMAPGATGGGGYSSPDDDYGGDDYGHGGAGGYGGGPGGGFDEEFGGQSKYTEYGSRGESQLRDSQGTVLRFRCCTC